MMNKTEVLQQVSILAEKQLITQQELNHAFDLGCDSRNSLGIDLEKKSSKSPVERAAKKLSIVEWLYYLGATIVLLGIFILFRQHWDSLEFSTKLLATLGLGIAAYISGVLFYRDVRTINIGHAFFIISMLLLPIGFWAVLYHAGIDADGSGALSLIYGLMLVISVFSQAVINKKIFIIFSILFSTLFFLWITNMFLNINPIIDGQTFSKCCVLIIGISYLLLGYEFFQEGRLALSSWLYQLGLVFILGSALLLTGWKPHQNIYWELLYPVIIFVLCFVSVYTQSKAFLVWSTVFLMAFIFKITSEYFSASLGWPLTLVIAGLAIIAIGYFSVLFKRKYLVFSAAE